jgi:hypothetical protein
MTRRGTLAIAAALLGLSTTHAQVLLGDTFSNGTLLTVNTATGGAGPFPGDHHLAMPLALRLGTNKPDEIEVCGLSLREPWYPFCWEPATRNDCLRDFE